MFPISSFMRLLDFHLCKYLVSLYQKSYKYNNFIPDTDLELYMEDLCLVKLHHNASYNASLQ